MICRTWWFSSYINFLMSYSFFFFTSIASIMSLLSLFKIFFITFVTSIIIYNYNLWHTYFLYWESNDDLPIYLHWRQSLLGRPSRIFHQALGLPMRWPRSCVPCGGRRSPMWALWAVKHQLWRCPKMGGTLWWTNILLWKITIFNR